MHQAHACWVEERALYTHGLASLIAFNHYGRRTGCIFFWGDCEQTITFAYIKTMVINGLLLTSWISCCSYSSSNYLWWEAYAWGSFAARTCRLQSHRLSVPRESLHTVTVPIPSHSRKGRSTCPTDELFVDSRRFTSHNSLDNNYDNSKQ